MNGCQESLMSEDAHIVSPIISIGPGKCKIKDCQNRPTKRGMCSKHYNRWLKHGDPLTVLKPCPRRGTGRSEMSTGYSLVLNREHPRAMQNGYVSEGILIAEKALGEPLPPKAEVHHINGIKNDNSKGNLLLCQDRAYHMLIHQRMRAIAACGHANWLKCAYCKKYDDPQKMYVRKNVSQGWHKSCRK